MDAPTTRPSSAAVNKCSASAIRSPICTNGEAEHLSTRLEGKRDLCIRGFCPPRGWVGVAVSAREDPPSYSADREQGQYVV